MKKIILCKLGMALCAVTLYSAQDWNITFQDRPGGNPFSTCKNRRNGFKGRNIAATIIGNQRQSHAQFAGPSKPKLIIDLSKYPLVNRSKVLDCGPSFGKRDNVAVINKSTRKPLLSPSTAGAPLYSQVASRDFFNKIVTPPNVIQKEGVSFVKQDRVTYTLSFLTEYKEGN